MVILKAFFSGWAWLQAAGSCCRFAIVDIFSHAMDDVFCGCGNIFLNINLHVMMYFVVVVIYFWNVNLYLIICRRLFSWPAWLASQVLLVFFLWLFAWAEKKKDASCVNGADWEGCDFPFSFLLFSLLFCSSKIFFLLQGQPGQEDGGGVHADPGFRSVGQKTLLVILFFHYQHHFDLLVCQSCHKIVFNLVAPRFPLNDAGRSIVAALAARILEDPQGPGFIRWTWPPIGMVGGLGVDTKSCLFTS